MSFDVVTSSRRQLVNITAEVQQEVRQAGTTDGVCHVFVPHTTASVVVNESADPDVVRDLVAAYETLIPPIRFAHSEGNSDAHFLATLLGCSVTLPIRAGRLSLGTWQGVFFVELDGPRSRKVRVTVVPCQR